MVRLFCAKYFVYNSAQFIPRWYQTLTINRFFKVYMRLIRLFRKVLRFNLLNLSGVLEGGEGVAMSQRSYPCVVHYSYGLDASWTSQPRGCDRVCVRVFVCASASAWLCKCVRARICVCVTGLCCWLLCARDHPCVHLYRCTRARFPTSACTNNKISGGVFAACSIILLTAS